MTLSARTCLSVPSMSSGNMCDWSSRLREKMVTCWPSLWVYVREQVRKLRNALFDRSFPCSLRDGFQSLKDLVDTQDSGDNPCYAIHLLCNQAHITKRSVQRLNVL